MSAPKDLDELVRAQGPEVVKAALAMAPAIPSPHADLARLLRRVEAFLDRYIAFPSKAQAAVAATWVAHTYAIGSFDFTPYLHITSPVKECGKTRVLECIRILVFNGWSIVSLSEAVLYRKIDAGSIVVLLDEVDTIYSGSRDPNKEGLRALLNAGFSRGVTVPRCVGKMYEVKEFNVFCPKVLAGIGKLPETVASRSIPIVLARKTRDQKVERFRSRDAEELAGEIRVELGKWAEKSNVIESLREARPKMPETLGDRQTDVSEPLMAIADAAGEEWPERLRDALVELFKGRVGEDEGFGVKLLGEIRRIFKELDTDRISTEELLKALIACEDAPWVAAWEDDIARGKTKGPASKLAHQLKQFGISPGTIRLPDHSTPKGYKREVFEDAWERYLPPG